MHEVHIVTTGLQWVSVSNVGLIRVIRESSGFLGKFFHASNQNTNSLQRRPLQVCTLHWSCDWHYSRTNHQIETLTTLHRGINYLSVYVLQCLAVQNGMLHSAGLSGVPEIGQRFNKPSFCFGMAGVLERSDVTILSSSSVKSDSRGRIRKNSCATLILATLLIPVGLLPHPCGLYRKTTT